MSPRTVPRWLNLAAQAINNAETLVGPAGITEREGVGLGRLLYEHLVETKAIARVLHDILAHAPDAFHLSAPQGPGPQRVYEVRGCAVLAEPIGPGTVSIWDLEQDGKLVTARESPEEIDRLPPDIFELAAIVARRQKGV